MKMFVFHETVYRYLEPANYGIQTLKLTPRRDAPQRTVAWRLRTPGRRVEQLDAFGNLTHLVTLEGDHDEVRITAEGAIETDENFRGLLAHEGALSPLAFKASTPLTRPSAAIESLARSVFGEAPADAARVASLLDAVANSVRYRPGTTEVSDTAADVVARGEGVCQDQAHVAIATCRAAGIPARYVSGYILDDGASGAASHAWIDVWIGQQWLSCDVTHTEVAGARLGRLAVGRDYRDAAPVRGVRRGGGPERLDVNVLVTTSAPQ